MRLGFKRIVSGMAALATLATAAPLILTATPASAAVASPPATVSGSVTMSPTSGTKSGNNFTSFSITLNSSTSCPGDSASSNYLWQTFFIDASVDLQTVQFGSTGPSVTEAADSGKMARALYNTSNTRVVNKQTDIGTATNGPISGIGTLKFTNNTSGTATIADGNYHVGVACTLGSAGTSQLKSYWSTVVTFSGGGTAWSTSQGNTEFTSLTPVRVVDTRPTYSGSRVVTQMKVGPESPLCVKIAGSGGVPLGASAVAMNVTATETVGAGFVTVYAGDATRPTASSLNYVDNDTAANMVVTKLDSSGQACFFTSTPAHLVVDVTGWFASGSSYNAVTPNRVFDTRPGTTGLRNVTQRKLDPTNVLEVQVTDLGAAGAIVPSSGVGAIAVNLTVTETTGAGYVTVYDCGTRPLAASLNYASGQTIANAVISKVSGTGTVCVYSSVAAHVIADVVGWFSSSGTYTATTPVRFADTRASEADGIRPVSKGKIGPSNTLTVGSVNVGPLPSSVKGLSLIITVDSTEGAGFVTVYPCGTRPNASSLNFSVGATRSNSVIIPTSATGDVCYYSMTSTHLIIDLVGYLT